MIEDKYFCYPKVNHTTESYTPPRLYTVTGAVYIDVSEHDATITNNKPGLLCPDHTTKRRDYSHSDEEK